MNRRLFQRGFHKFTETDDPVPMSRCLEAQELPQGSGVIVTGFDEASGIYTVSAHQV